MLKLDIGGGDTPRPGFVSVDRKNGKEAFPLDYPDNSVDDIYASHVLEHFGFEESQYAVQDWVRALKPGGLLQIAVPDFDVLCRDYREHDMFEHFLYGGQTDENDFHKSMWTEAKLRELMEDCGLVNVRRWEGNDNDCSAYPFSLNLEGTKSCPKPADTSIELPDSMDVKICACMTMGRTGLTDPRNVMQHVLTAIKIPLRTSNGVYYGHCMQRHFEEIVDDADLILTIDGDTLATKTMVDDLIRTICSNPSIDALAALQSRRQSPHPLLTMGTEKEVETDGHSPIKVTSAHFGLTLIRTEKLKGVEKPWFFSQPDPQGGWGAGRMDADIWFWHQWRLAGLNIYVDPLVNIGHMEEMVSYFDRDMKHQLCTISEWRDRFFSKGFQPDDEDQVSSAL